MKENEVEKSWKMEIPARQNVWKNFIARRSLDIFFFPKSVIMDARESYKKSGVQMHLFLAAKCKTPIDRWCLQMIPGNRREQWITTEEIGTTARYCNFFTWTLISCPTASKLTVTTGRSAFQEGDCFPELTIRTWAKFWLHLGKFLLVSISGSVAWLGTVGFSKSLCVGVSGRFIVHF